MQITDKNGDVVEVTDLDLAIEEADFGRGCRHEDTSMAAFDDKVNAYWQDFYDKLIALKNLEDKKPKSLRAIEKKDIYVVKHARCSKKPSDYYEKLKNFDLQIQNIK